MKPNKEAIRLWVEALRSGKYPQGQRVLCSEDGKYCPVGVLCEVAIKEGLPLTKEQSSNGYYSYSGMTHIIMSPLREWVGMDDSFFINGKSIYNWNDFEKVNFNTLANMIEQEFLNE